MWSWFAPKCPIQLRDKVWVERRMQWLAAQFGAAPLLETPMVLPTPEFFPDPFSGCEEDVRPMLVRVCGFMLTDPDRFDLNFFDGDQPQETDDGQILPSAAGFYVQRDAGQRPLIRINSKILNDPLALVATLAHEVAHDRLLGEKRLTGNEPDHEPLTDLTMVFFGLGIFPANTAFRTAAWKDGMMQCWQMSTQGYPKDDVFGYALGLRAWLRGETQHPWASHLSINPRTACHEGFRYLVKTNDSACSRVSVLNAVSQTSEICVSDLMAPSDTQRLSALMALWEHPSPTPEHVKAVEECLQSTNPHIQAEAIEWLRTQVDISPKAVHRLIELVHDGDDEAWLRAAVLLADKRPGADEKTPDGLRLVDELIARLVNAELETIEWLAEPLAAYGTLANLALSHLINALRPMLLDGLPSRQARAEWLIDLLLEIDPNLDQRIDRLWGGSANNLYHVAVKQVRRKPKSERFASRKRLNKIPGTKH